MKFANEAETLAALHKHAGDLAHRHYRLTLKNVAPPNDVTYIAKQAAERIIRDSLGVSLIQDNIRRMAREWTQEYERVREFYKKQLLLF